MQERRRFRKWRGRASGAQSPARRACAAASRQCRDRASADSGNRRRRTLIIAVDGQPERPVRTSQQLVSDGSWCSVRIDVRYAAQPRRRSPPRPARRRWRGRPPIHCDRVRGRADGRALRVAAARRQSAAAGGNRPSIREALRFCISGGGPAPFAINGATFVDWPPKPAYVNPRGRPAMFALANKTAVVQAIRLCGHVATLALDGRRLGALLARHHPHPARPHRPCRVRRRQPGQMAARIGDPRAPRSLSGNLVSGRVKRLTPRGTPKRNFARQSRFKRPPGNDGLADKRHPPRAGKEWWRTPFRNPSRRTGALLYSCRNNQSRRPEARARS